MEERESSNAPERNLNRQARIYGPSLAATAGANPRGARPHSLVARFSRNPFDTIPQASGISVRLSDAFRARFCRQTHLSYKQHGHAHAESAGRSSLQPLRRKLARMETHLGPHEPLWLAIPHRCRSKT